MVFFSMFPKILINRKYCLQNETDVINSTTMLPGEGCNEEEEHILPKFSPFCNKFST